MDLHLVGDDWPLRLQRFLRIAPKSGLGVSRRASILALIAWLPVVVLNTIEERGFPVIGANESLFSHYGVHTQCLIAIPLFVLGEAFAASTSELLALSIHRNELVTRAATQPFERLMDRLGRLRRSIIPWLAILVLAMAWVAPGARQYARHPGLINAADIPTLELGWAGVWYVYVSRMLFAVLLLGWLWRLVLWWLFLGQFAHLKLDLVPSHPDRVMGLGFLERTTSAFSPFVLGVTAVFAADAAHRMEFHGAQLSDFYALAVVYSVTTIFVLLAPLTTFFVPLTANKRRALVEYGGLVTQHDRLVRQRWIEKRQIPDESVLGAAELGPVADVGTLYASIVSCRYFPIGRSSILAVAVPLFIPMLLVSLFEIPIGELLERLAALLI